MVLLDVSPKEEHHRRRIVELVHGVEVWNLCLKVVVIGSVITNHIHKISRCCSWEAPSLTSYLLGRFYRRKTTTHRPYAAAEVGGAGRGLGVEREQTESSEASRGVGIVWCAAYSVPEACGHASELWKQDGELGELGDDRDMDETGVEVSGLNYR